MRTPIFSICATNFNCGFALESHLRSIYSLFDHNDFEYIVVDNFSLDNSIKIFRKYQKKYGNLKIFQHKCKRGKGRNIAFSHSKTTFIVAVDTDTVYFPIFKQFVYAYLKNFHYHQYGIRSFFAGIYTKKLLEEVGGWSNLQSDDYDMILKIYKKNRKARILPLVMGKNIKEQYALADRDYRSNRYNPSTKIYRFINSEREKLMLSLQLKHLNLNDLNKSLEVDMGLGKSDLKYLSNPVEYQYFTKYLKHLLISIGILSFVIFSNIFKKDEMKVYRAFAYLKERARSPRQAGYPGSHQGGPPSRTHE